MATSDLPDQPLIEPAESRVMNLVRWLGLAGGPLLAVIAAQQIPAQLVLDSGTVLELGRAAAVTAGLAVWMAVWWLTEAISIYVTALLPLALLPLSGTRTDDNGGSGVGDPHAQ